MSNEVELAKQKQVYEAMLEAKAFTVKNGEVVLIFDHLGNLKDIEITYRAYRRVAT
jgi:hypothetical protein